MSAQTNRGYVGFLLLSLVAVAIGVGAFVIYEREQSQPAYIASVHPEKIIQKENTEQMALAGELSIFDSKASTTTKEVTPPLEKGVTFFNSAGKNVIAMVNSENTSENVQKSNTKNTTQNSVSKPVIKKTQTEPVVAEKIEVVQEPTLVVTKGAQPAQTLLLANARRVPFTVVELTAKGGDIVVDSLEIERMGLASDRLFTEVGVIDVDSERALNGNHKYSTRESFTIKDGESFEVTLFGNIKDASTLTSYASQMPSLALSNIKTKAKIVGDLPIVGTTHIVNTSLTIGSITLSNSGLDPGANRTLYINDKNIIFSAVRATISSAEKVKLTEFTFTQSGSASPNDMSNVNICVLYKNNTKCYPVDINPYKKWYTADFGDDIVIGKGEFADIYIRGDIGTTGSNRTINFDMMTSYDAIGYGMSYKNYMYTTGGELDGTQPEGSFSTSEYPFYNGYAHTISAGSFGTIGK